MVCAAKYSLSPASSLWRIGGRLEMVARYFFGSTRPFNKNGIGAIEIVAPSSCLGCAKTGQIRPVMRV